MSKACIACGMTMEKPEDFAMQDEGKNYCVYCARPDGSMQSYDEKLGSMTGFIVKTQGLDEAAAKTAAIARANPNARLSQWAAPSAGMTTKPRSRACASAWTSEKGKRLYRERFKTVEPVFAWMKWATGFDRFRLKGKDGPLKEFLLLSIGHNIKQIAKHIRTLGPEDRKRPLAQSVLSLRGVMSGILFAIVKKNSPQN